MRRFNLNLLVLALGLALPAGCRSSATAHERRGTRLAEQLTGTWVMIGVPGQIVPANSGQGRLKFRTGRHWTLTSADPVNGRVLEHDGGTYTLNGDEYVESVEYANPSTMNFVGRTYRFRVSVEGDLMTQIGLDNDFREVWQRVR